MAKGPGRGLQDGALSFEVLSGMLLDVHGCSICLGSDEPALDGSGLSNDIHRKGRDRQDAHFPRNRSIPDPVRNIGVGASFVDTVVT